MNWHRLDKKEIFEVLGTSSQGLSGSVAEDTLLKVGPNQLQEGKKRSAGYLLSQQFKDLMILTLITAAIISGIIGDINDTLAIIVIVLLNATFGFIQQYHADRAMRALIRASGHNAKTLRNGKILLLAASRLVPGDIVLLEAGNAVPADVRIIESVNLRIEEAALTGESQSVDKFSNTLDTDELAIGDKTNMGFKGTFVTYGRGKGVVVATGMQTEMGRIAALLDQKETTGPLQKRMAAFGKTLAMLIIGLCVLVFIGGWWRGEEIVGMALTSMSLAVAAIPEALPVVISISLALAARRMVRMNTLIRKLPAIEALGSVTYICTDKTGTLTKNRMQVEQVFVNGHLHQRSTLLSITGEESLTLLLHAFALNNDCFRDDKDMNKGDSTELALIDIARQYDIEPGSFPRLAEIVFDPERKLMTTFHLYHGRIISFTKGAPDLLLPQCIDIDLPTLLQQVDDMAAAGQRVLGFACRYWNYLPENPNPEIHEAQLQFIGLAGLTDPPREEVSDAVAQCKTAGIIPVMITGDHMLTAKAIAQRIGIMSDKADLAIDGKQLASWDDDKFFAAVEHIKVYARVSPEQKLRVVKMLQKKGHCVAMTGDGVNDAPSLKRADIGIAMGLTGTDVSREAADIILLDDNFSTIISAVKEGRRIYDNILKFIKYLMTTNSSELWIFVLGPLIGLPVALLPIHILWINLVSDGLPAISLSFEKAEKGIMKRPPRPVAESIFINGRGFHMVWVGMLMAGISLSLQGWAIKNHLPWQTIVFNVLCLSQMGHAMAVRSEKQVLFNYGIVSNKLMAWSVASVFLLQVIITYFPFFQRFYHTEKLTLSEFLIVGVASSLVFLAVEIEKVIITKVKGAKNRTAV